MRCLFGLLKYAMCWHLYVYKYHQTKLRVTATALAVMLVTIIAYEVYSVTLNYGCSRFRRHPILRDRQALRLLTEQRSEVNKRSKLRVNDDPNRLSTTPDIYATDAENLDSSEPVKFISMGSLRSFNGDGRPPVVMPRQPLMEKQMIDRLIQDFRNMKTAGADSNLESKSYQTGPLVDPVHHSNQTQTAQSSHVTPSLISRLMISGNAQGNAVDHKLSSASQADVVNGQPLSQGSNPRPHVVILSKSELLNSITKKAHNPIQNPTIHTTEILHTAAHTNPVTIPPIPYMGNYKCRDDLCREFFSHLDKLFYDHCTDRLRQRHEKNPDLVPMEPGKCHFMNGTNRAAVALASFPGSGNTWLRGLLEQATGICTGAVYCDYGIRSAGFNGEGLRTGSVIGIKTHKTAPEWTDMNMPHNNMKSKAAPSYGAAILLIRNPLNALVAEWNREASKKVTYPGQNGSSIHVKYVGQEYFRENPQWNSFVVRKTKVWQQHFLGWVVGRQGHPVLVVRYEDLKSDVISQTKRMLDFLGVPYSDEELRKRMEVDFGMFHRKHHEDFEHFTPKQRAYVQHAVAETVGVLKERNNGDTLGVADYLDKTERATPGPPLVHN